MPIGWRPRKHISPRCQRKRLVSPRTLVVAPEAGDFYLLPSSKATSQKASIRDRLGLQAVYHPIADQLRSQSSSSRWAALNSNLKRNPSWLRIVSACPG